MQTYMSSFGARLRDARLARALTQRELGDLVGCSQQVVSRWEVERGELPKGAQIAALARALRVSADHLLGVVAA